MPGKKKLYFIIYKPYKILSQFTNQGNNKGLNSCYQVPRDVYPVGRLDLDSEGLLLLTNDKEINNRLLDPKFNHKRTYWVEVEGFPTRQDLDKLQDGVEIKLKQGAYLTKRCNACFMDDVGELPARNPPVNHKKYVMTTWIALELFEGKNRQVRRMTAAVGYPTLRLIRTSIEDLSILKMKPGEITQISEKVLKRKLGLL